MVGGLLIVSQINQPVFSETPRAATGGICEFQGGHSIAFVWEKSDCEDATRLYKSVPTFAGDPLRFPSPSKTRFGVPRF